MVYSSASSFAPPSFAPPPSASFTALLTVSPKFLAVELSVAPARWEPPLLPPDFFLASGTKLSESRTTCVPPFALPWLAASTTSRPKV